MENAQSQEKMQKKPSTDLEDNVDENGRQTITNNNTGATLEYVVDHMERCIGEGDISKYVKRLYSFGIPEHTIESPNIYLNISLCALGEGVEE